MGPGAEESDCIFCGLNRAANMQRDTWDARLSDRSEGLFDHEIDGLEVPYLRR